MKPCMIEIASPAFANCLRNIVLSAALIAGPAIISRTDDSAAQEARDAARARPFQTTAKDAAAASPRSSGRRLASACAGNRRAADGSVAAKRYRLQATVKIVWRGRRRSPAPKPLTPDAKSGGASIAARQPAGAARARGSFRRGERASCATDPDSRWTSYLNDRHGRLAMLLPVLTRRRRAPVRHLYRIAPAPALAQRMLQQSWVAARATRADMDEAIGTFCRMRAIHRMPDAPRAALGDARHRGWGETSISHGRRATFYQRGAAPGSESRRAAGHNLGARRGSHGPPSHEALRCRRSGAQARRRGITTAFPENATRAGPVQTRAGPARGRVVEYEASGTTRASASRTCSPPTRPLGRRGSQRQDACLLIGERGLGDEVMFAGIIPDMLERVGPTGRLLIACDHRLVAADAALVSAGDRSASQAHIKHNAKNIRMAPWARGRVQAGLLRAARHARCSTSASASRTFPQPPSSPAPEPARVGFWRERLSAIGPRPLCRHLLALDAADDPAAQVLSAPMEAVARAAVAAEHQTSSILQYGDCRADSAYARDKTWRHDHSISKTSDLKNNLDDNAALCAALDISMVSAPDRRQPAPAAGTGTETWFSRPPAASGRNSAPTPIRGTPRRGSSRPEAFGDWPALMETLAAEPVVRKPPDARLN